jgi:ABC-type methionine transport system permease subunit
MRVEISTAVKMWIVLFWVMTLCCFVSGYHHFGGICQLHIQHAGYKRFEAFTVVKVCVVIFLAMYDTIQSCRW